MKKFLVILTGLFLFSSVVLAEEVKTPVQDVDVDASGAVFLLNKQPTNTTNVQNIKVRRCGLVFVANINGKVEIQKQAENTTPATK